MATWEEVEEIARKKREAAADELAAMTEAAAEPEPMVEPEPTVEPEPIKEVMTEAESPRRSRRGV